MRVTMLVLLGGLSTSCGGDRCQAVTCSSRGTCVLETSGPRCACNSGFVASGLSCVPAGSAPASAACVGVGARCDANRDCCTFLAGDGYCVSGRCADACEVGGDCLSGCCAPLLGGSRTCAPATSCSLTCRAVNAPCTRNGDCCNFVAGDGYCVDGSCADTCSRNSQCVSGCCAPLVGGGSTCASRSACP
ncbi:MAG: hypothetical protein INH41_07095 [Myxococcaceae bacterium]|nr:hypothetical protein [Myxococcaceae bacterium]MCA3012151.1 hypothetical protein [Myxococcaceae bacterium]